MIQIYDIMVYLGGDGNEWEKVEMSKKNKKGFFIVFFDFLFFLGFHFILLPTTTYNYLGLIIRVEVWNVLFWVPGSYYG